MDKRQKKIISRTCFILLILISIAGIILVSLTHFSIIKDKSIAFLSIIMSSITPTTMIGILVKWIMNKYHKKDIKNLLIENGVMLSEEEEKQIVKAGKQSFRYKNFLFYEKEDKLIIKYTFSSNNQKEQWEELKQALGEYVEYKRKKIGC